MPNRVGGHYCGECKRCKNLDIWIALAPNAPLAYVEHNDVHIPSSWPMLEEALWTLWLGVTGRHKTKRGKYKLTGKFSKKKPRGE
jgi:hypothetical protein